MVLGDRTAIKRVLDNLVSIAIKYSPPKKNIFGMQAANGHMHIEVKDYGPGIEPEEQSKFGRFSSKLSGGEHSNGLGLDIARQLVKEMQGKIGCNSKPGEGATFYVAFKRVQPEERTA